MKLKTWILSFLLILLIPSILFAKTYVSQDNPTSASENFLGPTLHFRLGKMFGPVGASGIAEYGHRQLRLNGTLGFEFGHNALNGLKFSYEFLRQDLLYKFISGSTRQWVHQDAIGAAFKHVFNSSTIIRSFELGSYLSNAPSEKLGARSYYDTVSQSNLSDINRRIAGARAFGFSSALNFLLFHNTDVNLALNYDDYRYDIEYLPSSDRNVEGFGGTINVMQPLTQHVNLNLSSALRASYDQYKAGLNWTPASAENLALGIYGDYFDGRHQLNSYSDAGVTISYLLDNPNIANTTQTPVIGDTTYATDYQGVLGPWVLSPAVYMPTVLAVADMATSGCKTFTASGSGGTGTTITLDKYYRTLSVTVTNISGSPAGGNPYNAIYKDANGNTLGTDLKTTTVSTTSFQFDLPSGVDPTKVKSITVGADGDTSMLTYTMNVTACN